jgi:SAM-dependent methyltransferase
MSPAHCWQVRHESEKVGVSAGAELSESQAVPSERAKSLDPFTCWCLAELFSPTMIRAAALLERACDLHFKNLFRQHLAERLKVPKTAVELTEELGYTDSASIALEALLLRLSDRTELVRADATSGSVRFQRKQQGADTSADLEEVRRQFKSLGAGYSAAMDFLDFGAQHFVTALKDDPEFMDRVLSGRDARFQQLWDRATNEDPLQDAHGRMGAKVVEEVFDRGRILEIGGGTGNGARHLMSHFESLGRLHCLDPYIFTDMSLSFILTTRHKMLRSYPSTRIEWRRLDINRPFEEQGFPPQSVDLIYGVNAAHVARDVIGFLRECHAALTKRGKVVFAERVRLRGTEMAPRELTLNLSTYHRTAAIRNPEYRPMHCYLTPSGWLRVLELAGFRQSQLLPEMEALTDMFPNQYAAVVVGNK